MDTHWLISAGLVTSSIIAITANAFLLFIFCRRRGLRTVPNRFVINLLIVNLLSSLLLVPLLVIDQNTPSATPLHNTTTNGEVEETLFTELIANTTSFQLIESESTYVFSAPPPAPPSASLCYTAQMTASFVCTLSILSILLIGINQYFGVMHSLLYHVYINKCRSTVFILSTWLVAMVLGGLSAAFDSDRALWSLCTSAGRISENRTFDILNSVYALTFCFFVVVVPLIAICVIYVCIYTAAHKNSERMRKSTSTNLEFWHETRTTLPKARSAPDFMNYDSVAGCNTKVTRTCSDRVNFITSIKHKISNASVFKYREETRAAKISVLVIFLVFFCYLPYGVTLVLNSNLVSLATPSGLNTATLLLLVASNTISPFLFGYRNKRVKREIGRVFGVVPPKCPDLSVLNRRRSTNDELTTTREPFLARNLNVPQVIVTCKVENERKSILKRVSTNWTNYKKCNFITVPESCISGEARGSFSSASTQISNEDC